MWHHSPARVTKVSAFALRASKVRDVQLPQRPGKDHQMPAGVILITCRYRNAAVRRKSESLQHCYHDHNKVIAIGSDIYGCLTDYVSLS
jgi:hypothetical protein